MSQPTFESRRAVSRAEYFLTCADRCDMSQRNEHEANLEAAMLFGRAELHRLDHQFKGRAGWKPWWDALRTDESVQFLREQRDFILKEASPKVGQEIFVGHSPPGVAHWYFYEDTSIPAAETIRRHIARIRAISTVTLAKFGTPGEQAA
ncbi:MAG TPA: hypothetical protein VMP01_18930 [Pirellulaceae bacterium]|nr:hypothetical protein [Pirellulaceae bacterium]